MPVHPRWRGEHAVGSVGDGEQRGSSPLARGTLNISNVAIEGRRFIPAGAGNTDCCCWRCWRRSVHPRWRGEHRRRVSSASATGGSSPLARGTLEVVEVDGDFARFIPAGTGNTRWCSNSFRQLPVHPRWHGEHFFVAFWMALYIGSSPLARGTRLQFRADLGGDRFIPAGTGNTGRGRARVPGEPVHPRWHGEHQPRRPPNIPRIGSSPLARGTLPLGQVLHPYPRFIPAGTGNTLSVTNCPQRGKLAAKNLPTFPC